MLNIDLWQQIKKIPKQAGIYQYYDKNSRLLYVGKAKNLYKRVRSYFNIDLSPNPKNSFRIQSMVSQIHSIHTLIVSDEIEALVLENSFIKSNNPKYNILLRDDKTYPYIMINLNEAYPRFSITRKIDKKKDVVFFGPYPKGAKEILQSIYEIFPLIQQASCMRGKKTCLYYQINKCLGVCEFKDENTKQKYHNYVQDAISLMQNKAKMQKILEENMFNFAKNEFFEQALVCKKCIEILKEIKQFCVVDMKRLYNADILSIAFKDNQGILLKLFVRNGKVVSSHHIFVKANIMQNASDNEDSKYRINEEFEYEIYTQALLKILQEGSLCEEIIIANITQQNLKLLKDSIPDISNKLVSPKKGDKSRLAKLAIDNAMYLLLHKIKENEKEESILKDISNLFLMQDEIINIEVFDTSHHAGSFNVGGMISYNNNGFDKQGYRYYNLDGKDEYSQMREMLTRRVKNFDTIPPPSLWLIDGGKAQINIAIEILQSINVYVEVIAISKEKRDFKAYRSKGKAQDIIRSKTLELKLPPSDLRLQFLQKLRDEAHRFTISFHRDKKAKSILNQ